MSGVSTIGRRLRCDYKYLSALTDQILTGLSALSVIVDLV